MTLVSARGLTCRVGMVTPVDSIDLEVGAGELVALIGPTGAGKSTLLAMLAGDVRPAAGELDVGGQVPWDADPRWLALVRSLLPQHVPSDVPFTAGAVVAMGRRPHQVAGATDFDRDRTVMASATAAADVANILHLPFAVLSAGEQRRVSLARVLAQDTPLVLLDEPTTSLDIGHQERVMTALAGVTAGGRAVLAALHDVNLAASYANRIVLLDRGRVRADGSPDEVLDAGLLGSVYRQRMQVVRHPTRDRPLVIPVD